MAIAGDARARSRRHTPRRRTVVVLLSPPSLAPPWSVNLLCAFLLTGALLNAFWFVKIVKMAGKNKDHHNNHGKKGVMEHNSLFPPPLKEPSALRQSGSSGQLSDVV